MQLFKVSDKTILQYEDFKAIYASCLFFVQMFINITCNKTIVVYIRPLNVYHADMGLHQPVTVIIW